MSSPTLLVGLGGTGSKIVAKVSEMISDDQRRNISCVIFDTDANDIPAIKEKHSEIKVVQTSARMTIGEYLAEDEYASANWFPVNPPLDRKVLSEGAAQVRSISRLGFESAIRTGRMKPLEDAIQDLYKVDHHKADQSLRVTIVSSLAGGTGSGLILPVAMYIRRFLETKMLQSANIMRGFFILPEVFYDAIPADQRNNLKSNAYASLRELDAFLMKGSKTLSDEYKDTVRLVMPDLDGNLGKGPVDYDVMPYEFCFLFDAQNTNGEKLNSLEQYMDHAANIIYSMSIGPMNTRSNSSEDNVLRKLAKEKGRNRYAGAGASRLIYPYDDICQVIGLSWASKSISDQWLEYDKKYREDQKKALRQKEQGYAVKDVDRSQTYISLLENDAKNKKPFAKSIVQMVEPTGDNPVVVYSKYLDDLDAHLKDLAQKKLGDDHKKLDKALNGIRTEDEAEQRKGKFKSTLNLLKEYKKSIDNYYDLEVSNLAYSLFEGAGNEGNTGESYFIENIIRTGDEYMHPNAMRYLLIRLRNEMKSRQEGIQEDMNSSLKKYDDFEKAPYRRLESEDPKNIDSFKPKGILNQKKKYREAYNQVASDFRNQLGNLDTYLENKVKQEIYKEGILYLNSLIEGFEAFYDALEDQLGQINERKEEIYHKYTQAPGMTVRYVAASPKCLDKLVEQNPYHGSLITVDSELSKNLSEKIFDYARKQVKPNKSRYFSDLFEEQILSHYQESANKELAGKLDNGILSAIEIEADLLLSNEQKESSMAVDQYVRDVINDTRALSTPFIEKPSELNASPIYACAFHSSLKPKRGDESYEARLIQEELVSKGGIADDDVDKNSIMFYQSYYGLRANSLSKFSPPRNFETYRREGGEYFTAYTELVKGIHPNSRMSQEITPHIDKKWHLAANMPDLDEGNQIIEEYGINAAFFWALALRLLDFKKDSSGRSIYELNKNQTGLDSGILLKDEKNESTKISDVLYALAIQPVYVSTIRKFADGEIEKDVNTPVSMEKQDVYRKILKLSVPVDKTELKMTDYGDSRNELMDFSLFDLPWVLKVSQTQGTANDAKLLDLLTVAMKETVRYISSFSSPEELTGKIRSYMSIEYSLFLNNLNELVSKIENGGQNLLKDDLITDILETAANFLKEYRVMDLSEKMKEQADQLKWKRI